MLRSTATGPAVQIEHLPEQVAEGWVWVDIVAEPDELDELVTFVAGLRLDPLAVFDTVHDEDLPKFDDFEDHLLVVLHGLGDEEVRANEVDCFVTTHHLVTVRGGPSLAIEALWEQCLHKPGLVAGGPDLLTARLADVMTRRLLSVIDVFEDRIDELVAAALAADGRLLGELTAVRSDLAAVRRSVHPQREALDRLRASDSPLLTDVGRRRFSDVFDVAERAAYGLDAARSALAETLDAYRSAEARQATDVSKVLTIYAAVLLPMSLIAGVYGMNFTNLPLVHNDRGWVILVGAMLAIAVLSLGVFVAIGWIRRPSGRRAGEVLGRGLIEAARAPVQMVGALIELPARPVAQTARRALRRTRSARTSRPDDRPE